ncbi:unnamed protein product [Nippostrongylus brasiliensis]|uniref:GTD-binding domain-containing protein n=1 Tax=Nippostrongylus brasiliensis TaxID=27835 RepID=A0A0N4XIU8_NIPBR|nr:unnamed protein product [Nippostrongylus brasiliensis]
MSLEAYEDSGEESQRVEHELEQVEEAIKRWDQMRAVLEMYDEHHRESASCDERAGSVGGSREYSDGEPSDEDRLVMACRLDSAGEESHSSNESDVADDAVEGDFGTVARYSPIAIQTA